MEQRIATLERQCRWYRNLFILAGLIAVALVTWGATKPIPDVIKAREFWVVSDAGKIMGTLSVHEGRAAVTLGEKAIAPIAIVSSYGFTILNKKLEALLWIGYDENGGQIQLFNKTGEEIIQIHADEYGNGVVGAYNRKGKGRTLTPGPQ